MRCCSVSELKSKEVISEQNGCRLGYVNDVELDLKEGRLVASIVWGKSRFGFVAHDCDIRICWEDIAVIGVDDNEEICENTVPTLTTLCQPQQDLGRDAVKVLLGVINEGARNEHLRIETTLRPGGTVGSR